MYEIQKNVPFPKNIARQQVYPFATMEIGDSFFIAGPGKETEKLRSICHSLDTTARHWCYKHNRKQRFITRIDTYKGVQGVRCWRFGDREKPLKGSKTHREKKKAAAPATADPAAPRVKRRYTRRNQAPAAPTHPLGMPAQPTG